MASSGATPPWGHSSGCSAYPAWLCGMCCGRMPVLGHEWQKCHLSKREWLQNPSPCPGGSERFPCSFTTKQVQESSESHTQHGHAVKNWLPRSWPQLFLSQHVRYHFGATFAALCWMSMTQLAFEIHSVREQMFISVAPNRKWHQVITRKEGARCILWSRV